MGETEIIKAIDNACEGEIAKLVSVLVYNLTVNEADAAQKFEAGLQLVMKANRIAKQAVTPSVGQNKVL
jgi:hypothetical protein